MLNLEYKLTIIVFVLLGLFDSLSFLGDIACEPIQNRRSNGRSKRWPEKYFVSVGNGLNVDTTCPFLNMPLIRLRLRTLEDESYSSGYDVIYSILIKKLVVCFCLYIMSGSVSILNIVVHISFIIRFMSCHNIIDTV